MTSTAIVALTSGDNNTANYNDLKEHARILGDNMRTERGRVRKLARSFILAAVDDNYQLEGLIEDCREKMAWPKLDKTEKNRMNVFFSTCRTIVGVWPKLPEDVQKSFRDGKLVYSTLAETIKDAKKAAEKAEAEAEGEGEGENEAQVQAEAQAQAQAPVEGDPIVSAMRTVALFVDETALDKMSTAQLLALKNLSDAIDEFRANAAKPVEQKKAA